MLRLISGTAMNTEVTPLLRSSSYLVVELKKGANKEVDK